MLCAFLCEWMFMCTRKVWVRSVSTWRENKSQLNHCMHVTLSRPFLYFLFLYWHRFYAFKFYTIRLDKFNNSIIFCILISIYYFLNKFYDLNKNIYDWKILQTNRHLRKFTFYDLILTVIRIQSLFNTRWLPYNYCSGCNTSQQSILSISIAVCFFTS